MRNKLTQLASIALFYACMMIVGASRSAAAETGIKGALISAEQTDAGHLRSFKADHYNAVVLAIDGANATKELKAARAIRAAGFDLFYWIEIGRNPALADAHT